VKASTKSGWGSRGGAARGPAPGRRRSIGSTWSRPLSRRICWMVSSRMLAASTTVSRPSGSRSFFRYQSRRWSSVTCSRYSASGFVACRSSVGRHPVRRPLRHDDPGPGARPPWRHTVLLPRRALHGLDAGRLHAEESHRSSGPIAGGLSWGFERTHTAAPDRVRIITQLFA
jgi:hypothetical protein